MTAPKSPTSLRSLSYYATLLMLLMVLTGCIARVGRDIFPSTSPVVPGMRGQTYGRGSDCQYFLLRLLPLNETPDTFAALEGAKIKANSPVLTDVIIDEVLTDYILVQKLCVRVTGLGIPKNLLFGK